MRSICIRKWSCRKIPTLVSPLIQNERVWSPKEFRECTDSFFVSRTFRKAEKSGVFLISPTERWFLIYFATTPFLLRATIPEIGSQSRFRILLSIDYFTGQAAPPHRNNQTQLAGAVSPKRWPMQKTRNPIWRITCWTGGAPYRITSQKISPAPMQWDGKTFYSTIP